MATEFSAPAWHFVPPELDAGTLAAIEPLFDELLQRPLGDTDALERWLRDESELLSRISAEQARRYVKMTCDTKDEASKQAYLQMEQQVMPRVRVLGDALDRHFLDCPALGALDPVRYETLIRRRRTQREIFRAENTALQQQEAELQTRQQAIMGGITVEFDGATRTLQQLASYYDNSDRSVREAAFHTALAARKAHWHELEEIYDELVRLRTQIARNAGFRTFTPYRFLELGRYDYDEAACRQLHDAIAECVVPAVRKLDAQRAERLGLPALRPWDLEVDPEGRPPLRPFSTQDEVIAICRKIFAAVDPRFAAEFDALVARDMLDLISRPGKAPGGYQYQLEDVRLPFIFCNGVGLHQDVQTLLHEGGHAFHSLLCREFDLLAFRDYSIEIAETASMSMELMGLEHLDAAYSPADAERAYRKHLEGVLRTLTWIASIDALQHWVYGNPKHSRDERRTAWLDIRRRFGGEVDWSGLDDALAMQWIAQTHLFNHAFYYIEYGIAQIMALQIWRSYRRDPQRTVAAYREALALGGTRPLPEIIATAGIRFDLSADTLRGLVDDVMAGTRNAGA
ncbi:MAG: M3 family oligoendopeptidase [Planctomycetes bacterium]|nr:M3 family oligoendopeptidase [Planctomycetota bacterium]